MASTGRSRTPPWTSGRPPWRTFSRVTLPLITPGILAAGLLSFALSIDDFIVTFFNSGSVETFPLRIFGASRTELSPQINVLATVIIVVSVAVMAIGVLFRRRLDEALGPGARVSARPSCRSASPGSGR